ncbi:MAG: hypothetical protein RLZZ450_1850 [Pseudomonadota bacterium]|jgi:hypothetical protein
MTSPSQRAAFAGALLAACCAVACANDPYPDQADKRSVSAELFHFVCKRVAREPDEVSGSDLNGIKYGALCDEPPEDLSDEPMLSGQPRLRALLERREAIVEALAETIGDLPVDGGATFADDELKDFLHSLVPFYDDERLPTASRKIAELLGLVVNPDDERAVAVIDQLAKISPRVGYRVAHRALGAVRPFLSYDGLDKVEKVLLSLFGQGGDAHDELVRFLEATALELADDAEPKSKPEDSTLHAVLELLLAEDKELAEGAEKLLVVRRDTRGFAQAVLAAPFVDGDGDGLADLDEQGRFVVEGSDADRSPWPFPKARGVDPVVDRDANGRALNASGEPMFSYFDANATVLAASMREIKPLIQRDEPGKPSTLENASRGLRPLLGPSAPRTYGAFKQPFAFEGPDLKKSPLLEMVHAVAVIIKQPEARRALELLKELMKQEAYESTAAGPLYAGLRIDERSDDPKHNDAFIAGADGKRGTPHQWWDDTIALGVRMLRRPGLIQGLVRAFSDPLSSMQGQLYANWMKYNDVVTYKGAPLVIDPATGKYTEAEAKEMNTPRADFEYTKLVDRDSPDTSMNRSIWQRTMSLLHTINGSDMCNKEGASLSIDDPLPLTFPLGGTYKRCEFVEIPDPGEAYAQALLKKLEINLKDQGLKDLATLGSAIGLVGTTSEIQEKESQIVGFNDKPSGESLARMMFAPSNKFMQELFGDILTNDGLPLKKYEPYALFPMEVLDKTALVDGKAQSFITNGIPLLRAFEDNELRDGKKLLDGYMFGHFLDHFHMHWTRPKTAMCPEQVEEGVSEGCTQSMDPDAKFFSYQSNIVSYEPLIIESFIDEKLTQILQKSSAQLATIKIGDKDGIAVLAEFVEMMLRPNDLTAPADGQLTYRDGRRWAATNTCVVPAGADARTPPDKCDCPLGTSADGDKCKVGERIVPRGKIVGASPMYLLLDALKGFDRAFEGDDDGRHEAWLAARSTLVDRFLGVEPVAAEPLKYRFTNPRSRKIAVKGLEWAMARIDAHEGDLASWADGLPARAEKVLSHPMVARGLDLLDVFWQHPDAGDEFAAVASYLMDADQYPDAFSGIVVAAADTLTFLDRDPNLTPIVQFASLAVAPNAFSALDEGDDVDVENGVLLKGLELTKDIVDLHEGDEPSAISKLLKNLVLANEAGESPLEVIFDSIAEVNRDDPSKASDAPMSPSDVSGSLARTQSFLQDKDRGLERIYRVIQSRNLNAKLPETDN